MNVCRSRSEKGSGGAFQATSGFAQRNGGECRQALLVEPGKYAREAEIEPSLKSMQEIVGGLIETVYPWQEKVCAVCNDSGKIDGLPLNRVVNNDIIAGTFFICGLGEEDFKDLSPKQMQKYKKMFYQPEVIFPTSAGVLMAKYDPKEEKTTAEKTAEKPQAEQVKARKPRQQER